MAKILTTKKFLLQIERARLEADLKSMKSTSQKTADSTLDNKIPDLEKVHSRSEAVPRIYSLHGNQCLWKMHWSLFCSMVTLFVVLISSKSMLIVK